VDRDADAVRRDPSEKQEPHILGYTLRQLWDDSEPAIGRKSSPSSDLKKVTFAVQLPLSQ